MTFRTILLTIVVGASGVVTATASTGPADDITTARPARTALIVDAAIAASGRDVLAPELRRADAVLRLPRTTAEARTSLRYLAATGDRVIVVAGARSRAAARELRLPGVRFATDRSQALAAVRR